jgi:hypothetical protein
METLIIAGSVIGGCALLMLVFYLVVRCLTRNRSALNNRVGVLSQTNGRTRTAANPTVENSRQGEPQAGGSGVQTHNDMSNKKYKIVRAFPEKDIPTTLEYFDIPSDGFRLSLKDPIVMVVGGKPVGKPRYLTESGKSLTQSKGRLDGYKGVIVKPNPNTKGSGQVGKRVIIEEDDNHDISNLSLVGNTEFDLAKTKPNKK